MSSLFETNKKPVEKQKLRGGYYTPLKLAYYLSRWAIRDGTERILEPSAGDGNFIVAAFEHCSTACDGLNLNMVAIEIEKDELQKAVNRVIEFNGDAANIEWINDDFFKQYGKLKVKEKFDVILGNPPFIRFQYFDDKTRDLAFGHLRDANYTPTKLSNAWAAFIQLSIELLKNGGRLAMVVPAELLQVKYASELRSRLSKQFKHIVIIGFKKLVFPDIQQEVLLLLAEGKMTGNGIASNIYTIEFEDGEDLLNTGDLNSAIAHVPSKHSRNGMKWTSLFLGDKSFNALDEAEQAEGLIRLGDLAEVDIGIVTGRNSFFVLSKGLMESIGASDFSVPIIGKTSTLTSIIYNENDYQDYSASYPSYLLNLTGFDYSEIPESIRNYISSGEQENVHTGYKCRIRPKWYNVPSVYSPDGFLFRQIHKFPLLVVNEAKTTSTDTIHRVRFKPFINPRLLAATCFNSLTLAWSEVCGRSYGGGVLELEPREAEELPIPYNVNVNLDIEKVDALLRSGKETDALNYVDDFTLKDLLGFDYIMINNIRNAWYELRNRRIYRR